MVYPRSHLCKSLERIGCQRANSHQEGIVDGQVDHNEKGIKPRNLSRVSKESVLEDD
jgi:hypothetical protein